MTCFFIHGDHIIDFFSQHGLAPWPWVLIFFLVLYQVHCVIVLDAVVSFAGALLSVSGLFLTSFIQEAHKMYVTYGLVWGVGSSFSYVSSIVVLGEYFNRRLALANGITSCGGGVGSLVTGPVINYLLASVG